MLHISSRCCFGMFHVGCFGHFKFHVGVFPLHVVTSNTHSHTHTQHTLVCHSQCGFQYPCSLEFGSAPGPEPGSAPVATNDILAMLSSENERVHLQKVWSSPLPSSPSTHSSLWVLHHLLGRYDSFLSCVLQKSTPSEALDYFPRTSIAEPSHLHAV